MTIAEGLEARGIVKGHCEVATNALSKGYAIETVVDLTGLDLDVVEQLKRDLDDS